jgi:hypothetical protein
MQRRFAFVFSQFIFLTIVAGCKKPAGTNAGQERYRKIGQRLSRRADPLARAAQKSIHQPS